MALEATSKRVRGSSSAKSSPAQGQCGSGTMKTAAVPSGKQAAVVPELPTMEGVLSSCDNRIAECQSIIANISTIRDLLHDFLDKVRSSNYRLNAAVEIELLRTPGVQNPLISAYQRINEHLLQFPKAPNWAPYTYPDSGDQEKELGPIPGFEILHCHGDTSDLVQWLMQRDATNGCIFMILDCDRELFDFATEFVELIEAIKEMKKQWIMLKRQVQRLGAKMAEMDLTAPQIKQLYTRVHPLGRPVEPISDIVIDEADKVYSFRRRLMGLEDWFDVQRRNLLNQIAQSRLLTELRGRILHIEVGSGRRQETVGPIGEANEEGRRIDREYWAPFNIAWNHSTVSPPL